MFNEYDVVLASHDINDKVHKGSKGTILIVYDSNPNQYEVEFIDNQGNTLDILTVKQNDIEVAL